MNNDRGKDSLNMRVVFSLPISSRWREHWFCTTTEIKKAAPHPSRAESVWQGVKYKKWRQLRVFFFFPALLGQERFDLWPKEQVFSLRPVYLMFSKLNVTQPKVGYFRKVQLTQSNRGVTHWYLTKEEDFDRNSPFNFPRKNQDKQETKTWEK